VRLNQSYELLLKINRLVLNFNYDPSDFINNNWDFFNGRNGRYIYGGIVRTLFGRSIVRSSWKARGVLDKRQRKIFLDYMPQFSSQFSFQFTCLKILNDLYISLSTSNKLNIKIFKAVFLFFIFFSGFMYKRALRNYFA
jgi:hypothetical protein